MNKTEMIKELRNLTSAGMNDCREAIEQSGGDLQRAVDLIKTKGLNIADGRSGRAASEGTVCAVVVDDASVGLVEINCQTDFVANSHAFKKFTHIVGEQLSLDIINNGGLFQHDSEMIENFRKDLVATTKENVVVRRWWVEESYHSNARVFHYVHSNNKIGVLLTLVAPSKEAFLAPDFTELGENMAMQIAAMNPLAVSSDRLSTEDVVRQALIFETQLTELNKPQAAWPKILEGKMSKWHESACLLNQNAVWLNKTTVQQVVDNTGKMLGGKIEIINFVRCMVGEGIKIDDKLSFAEEVGKLSGI
jgi:elongation factor Ts